jgi:hypothetical protein
VVIGPPNEVRVGEARVGLPDDTPRDFRLSPDGRILALRLVGPGQARLLSVDLGSGQIRPEAGEALVWGPGPGRTLVRAGRLTVEAGGRLSTLAAISGDIEPLGWDPSGRHLAVRWLRGNRSGLSIVDASGAERPLDLAGYPEFIGWAGAGQ